MAAFPADLTYPDLEYSGIYEDGWIAESAFFSLSQPDERGDRSGVLVEYDATQKIFTSPSEQRTEDYVTGRFG